MKIFAKNALVDMVKSQPHDETDIGCISKLYKDINC